MFFFYPTNISTNFADWKYLTFLAVFSKPSSFIFVNTFFAVISNPSLIHLLEFQIEEGIYRNLIFSNSEFILSSISIVLSEILFLYNLKIAVFHFRSIS